jgi:hypothetical protein
LLSAGVVLTVAAAAGFGYWLGSSTSRLDRALQQALQVRNQANEATIAELTRELAQVRLAQSVDAEAAASLRDTITGLRTEVADLQEEVSFYRTLMAPSDVERGLKIAEFELAAGEAPQQYRYRVLLTQAEARRDWVQGGVELQVQGVRDAAGGRALEREGSAHEASEHEAEEVLTLTDLAEPEAYPLKFRFRYFQDLTGTLTLPEGFRPRSVRVTATPQGRGERLEREFDWRVQAG